MKTKFTCKGCFGNYKSLDPSEFCAFCYLKEYGKWSPFYTGDKESYRDMGGKTKKKAK